MDIVYKKTNNLLINDDCYGNNKIDFNLKDILLANFLNKSEYGIINTSKIDKIKNSILNIVIDKLENEYELKFKITIDDNKITDTDNAKIYIVDEKNVSGLDALERNGSIINSIVTFKINKDDLTFRVDNKIVTKFNFIITINNTIVSIGRIILTDLLKSMIEGEYEETFIQS